MYYVKENCVLLLQPVVENCDSTNNAVQKVQTKMRRNLYAAYIEYITFLFLYLNSIRVILMLFYWYYKLTTRIFWEQKC